MLWFSLLLSVGSIALLQCLFLCYTVTGVTVVELERANGSHATSGSHLPVHRSEGTCHFALFITKKPPSQQPV